MESTGSGRGGKKHRSKKKNVMSSGKLKLRGVREGGGSAPLVRKKRPKRGWVCEDRKNSKGRRKGRGGEKGGKRVGKGEEKKEWPQQKIPIA